ncbi:uncharacterized protein LOC131317441 [Rhododendron vialii]|uniref:uncharacterized protein LOC131317441 n=1 Tax=Rhododendron vialii TaxID=182163 RepID=UPI00265D97FA|nr:uncharacterized protein LOC131317441 [Rhododendron vialii]
MVSQYPTWVANTVLIPKKNGQIRVCVDFRDLNRASPKDDFPLPHIDVFVDNIAGHAMLSFMDDDMIAKSKTREGHVLVLRKFFERLRKYRMRLNPQKYTFGVTTGKMLGFLITTRGIEVDPSKIEANPPVLMPPILGKPLILYLSVNPSSMGCKLAQEGDKGVEKAIYYLSKKMVGCEERYTAVEKTCWALVWASKKLRHCMLAYPMKLISRMDPLKYLFKKSALTDKLTCWLLLLAEFDLEYVTRTFVKGRAVTEFLADHPVDGPEDSDFVFPDEKVLIVVEDVWTLYFDGATNQKGYGIGAALTLSVEKLKVTCDSNLVVYQANGDWKVREEKLKLYHQNLEDLIPRFNKDCPTYQYVNAIDDVNDGLHWYHDIWNFVESGEYLAEASKKDQLALRRIAAQYILCGGKLYKRSHCGMHKLCVNGLEAARIMEEVHEGVCGPHMSGVMLARKILRKGYFWSTMESQCVDYRKIARAFNKKVKSRDLVEGDMVTKEIRVPVFDPRGKFRPKRSGPYIIKTILSGGAAQLINLDCRIRQLTCEAYHVVCHAGLLSVDGSMVVIKFGRWLAFYLRLASDIVDGRVCCRWLMMKLLVGQYVDSVLC